jgi:hypothetical protein
MLYVPVHIKNEDIPVPEEAVYEVAGRGIRALHEALLHTLHDRVPFPKPSQTSLKGTVSQDGLSLWTDLALNKGRERCFGISSFKKICSFPKGSVKVPEPRSRN